MAAAASRRRRRFRRAGSPRRRVGAWRRLVLTERLRPGRRPLTNTRPEPGSNRVRTASCREVCNASAQLVGTHDLGGAILAGVCCTAGVCRLAELIWNSAPCISSWWLRARRRISTGSSQGGACDELHAKCVRCDRARVDRASHAGPVRVPEVPGYVFWPPVLSACASELAESECGSALCTLKWTLADTQIGAEEKTTQENITRKIVCDRRDLYVEPRCLLHPNIGGGEVH